MPLILDSRETRTIYRIKIKMNISIDFNEMNLKEFFFNFTVQFRSVAILEEEEEEEEQDYMTCTFVKFLFR